MGLSQIIGAFLDIVYPRDIRCSICGRREDVMKWGICASCLAGLPFIKGQVCQTCGKPVSVGTAECYDCRLGGRSFVQGASVFEYAGVIRTLVYRFKYGGQVYLGEAMAGWMAERVRQQGWDFDCIIPVPLHPVRQKKRGFNQAGILARKIGAALNRAVLFRCLLRVRDTPPQTAGQRQHRLQNLKGAFLVKGQIRIAGRACLLVDDIYTTGSTADECARTLVEAGAAAVYVITLAAGRNA